MVESPSLIVFSGYDTRGHAIPWFSVEHAGGPMLPLGLGDFIPTLTILWFYGLVYELTD